MACLPQVGEEGRESAGKYGASVDVEDFAGDKSRKLSAEEEDGPGDLGDVCRASYGDSGVGAGGILRAVEDAAGHLRVRPSRSDAVGVDAVRSELGGERLSKRDDGAFAGGVVGVASFAALSGSRGDEHDVASRRLQRNTTRGDLWVGGGTGAGEHVGGSGMKQAKDAVHVCGLGASPLGCAHIGNCNGDRWPYAVVGDQNVQIAEGFEGAGNQGFAIFGRSKLLLNRKAEVSAATLAGEGIGPVGGGVIAERDACSGLAEEADGGCADAA